jgi:hypothetical protein
MCARTFQVQVDICIHCSFMGLGPISPPDCLETLMRFGQKQQRWVPVWSLRAKCQIKPPKKFGKYHMICGDIIVEILPHQKPSSC